jgi:hypothetical protein
MAVPDASSDTLAAAKASGYLDLVSKPGVSLRDLEALMADRHWP